MKRLGVIEFVVLVSALVVSSPGEDLTMDQAKAAFSKADRTLNKVYQEAKAALPESMFAELQEDQRIWIDYRDSRSQQAASVDGGAEEGREKLNVEYWRSLCELTEERVEMIGGWIKWDSFASEWEGVWRDGSGGWLRILENEDGKFLFALEVVRGPTYHMGNIGGPASWNGSTARFTTESQDEDGETWLTFIKRGLKLELIAANASSFHGARAYFDGDYVRVSELSDEEREEILSSEN